MEEQWVFIRGYEERYLISNLGRVKSVVNGKDITEVPPHKRNINWRGISVRK